VKKIYYAIVVGELPEKEWIITKKLERIENAQNENKVRVSKNGQKAVTNYKVLNKFNLKTKEWDLVFSELEVEIKTWRMHQIRVHLADLWNPILWDKIYWDKKLNAFLEKNYWLKRQALHAWKIEFFHYGRWKEMKLEAKIKEDIKEFLEKIKK
jgi:23S rRNA-/tRNA-specific pseudouridylate synthase